MGKYTILTNQSVDIHAADDFLDNGWSIASGVAIHESCNEGEIVNREFVAEPGKSYKVKYTVSNLSSGSVHVVVGGTVGESRTENGTYTETIVASDSSGISFWSDGDLRVSGVIISDGEIEGRTFVFNERYKVWAGYRSYLPEFASKFLDDVFAFRDGALWKQNTNQVRNNFFGDQYSSIITFYVNISPSQVKNFYTIRLKSNKVWNLTDIYLPPREGKSNGQRSRLKKGRFKNLQGDWFSEFLRDITDPRFVSELDALFNGALLQGNWMEITMENNDTVEFRLASVDVQVDPSLNTY